MVPFFGGSASLYWSSVKKNRVWEMGVRTSLKEYSDFYSKTISEMLLTLP